MNRVKLFLTIILCLTFSSVCYAQEIQTVSSQDISGGVNEFDRESLIGDNQSTVLKNATIRQTGKALKRAGCTEISGNATASSIVAIAHYYKLGDATKRLCVVGESTPHDLDVYNGTSWTTDVFTDLTASGELEIFTAGV